MPVPQRFNFLWVGHPPAHKSLLKMVQQMSLKTRGFHNTKLFS
ncbi:hypothetical protein [Microcoleus sp. T2B6]